ncbi:MAG: hypothetical protein ACO2PN_26365 [Pyrobaculum sp.]|jgi:hypothetical protein
MEMWRRRGKAASAAALYSVNSGLYSEAVVSSVASAVALAEVGQFREAVQYVQRAAKALYEAAKEAFEKVKVTVQRLVELFVEAVTRVLAWVDEHKAYLFLMAAAAAGVVALSAALNMWGLVELEKLAYAAVGAPFVAGLVDTGGRAAERFRVVAERWRVGENEKQKIEEVINKVLNAPQKREGPFSKLTRLENLPPPLVELRKSLTRVENEVEKDAAVVAALVLYKTLVKNAEAYGTWAELYKWARGLVEKQEFTVTAGDIERLRGAQSRLEEVAEEVRRELNRVLVLYSQSDFYKERPDLLNKLKQLLEVDLGEAEGLAKARSDELSKYSDANMGTKVYAALLSVARGGIYGHAAMLLMGESALADIVLSTPATMHWMAGNIAKMRGETVDPSYSRKEAKVVGIAGRRGEAMDLPHVKAADWRDRTASVLLRFLIGYGEIDPQLLSGAGEVSLKFRLVEKEVKKDGEKKRVERGFQVFRSYGGVEAFVGELWIGDVARFKVSKEELRRFVEEAMRMAPDLSGIRKIWQTLEWLNTDVSFTKRQIAGSTAYLWQLRWYLALFGEGRAGGGMASVTEEGIKLIVTMLWRREVLDRIIAEEGEELEPLLGRPVKSWRELVDAIDWSWVLKKVEELASELKPWIGREDASDAEREGLARKMLGELALLAHFAEARRGVDDGEWREERAKRLARVVETLSGGKIAGERAERLAKLIIRYAESRAERAKKRIENLAKEVNVSREEMWGIVDFVLNDMYCLVRGCARDEVVRKFVAPALELIMLDKALNEEFDREKALLIFGEMYATALAGDGHVGPREIRLAVGRELGGGATLLRLATLHLFNQLLSDKVKFGIWAYEDEGVHDVVATGENAAMFMRLLAVSAPSAGGEYLSEKFNEFVKETKVEVRLDKDSIRLTEGGNVAADLTLSEGGVAVKYNVYLLKKAIELQFHSTDRSHAELAARLLRLAGVSAEVKKVGGRDEWQVWATTDKLAAGREELRKAIAEVVETARDNGWVDAGKAKRWLKKLEEGRVSMEGRPKYNVKLDHHGALVVRFESTNPDSIEREAQRLRKMGLVEDKHFTVKMPEEGHEGYVRILKKGLAYAAWLSVHGEDEEQRRLAAAFVELILQRAREAGENVLKKAEEIVEKGKERRSLTLNEFEKKVEVNGKEYVVKVIGGEAVEEDRGGRKLLRIRITAGVGRVEGVSTRLRLAGMELTRPWASPWRGPTPPTAGGLMR